jgi:5-methylcytosine-specific restriction endonuclease McrA
MPKLGYARIDYQTVGDNSIDRKKRRKRKKRRFTGKQRYIAKHIKANQSDRNSKRYWAWRKKVLSRDNWTCQDCGKKGRSVQVIAHHIKMWVNYPALRFTVSNGRTVCEDCHILIHPWINSERCAELKATLKPNIGKRLKIKTILRKSKV